MAINGKPRIVVWFVSNDGRYIGAALNILERQHNGIELIGVTATQKISVNNLPFIPLNEINMNGGGIDIILLAGGRQIGMAEVTKFAKSINLDVDKLLGDWIVCIPGFTLQKYRQLQRSRLSIFVRDCFGGMLSHTLGLEFFSPFVNLYLLEDEYIRFIRHPRVYMEEEFNFQKNLYDPSNTTYFPVATLGNISLYLLHYKSFKEAEDKWNQRKNKINWYNLLPVMYTSDPEILQKFEETSHGKKVAFTSFKSDSPVAFYINPEWYTDDVGKYTKKDLHPLEYNKPNPPDHRIELIIHLYFANGLVFYYDVFDMLLYGKKTPLIEM